VASQTPQARGVAGERRFSAVVEAVTHALGDPTRRAIYLYVRAHPGTTATEVAARFSLHPNVARHHLDRLAVAGYVTSSYERSRAGAGRPAKRYRATKPGNEELSLEVLARRDELMVALLAEALERIDPAEAEEFAERVGERYGRRLVEQMGPGEGQRSLGAAMQAVAEVLTAHGFAAHAEQRGPATAVVAEQCPFGEAATAHPVLCAVDRGLIQGLLRGLCGDTCGEAIPVTLSSRARGDEVCAAVV
jgi:predicted ArsR family transcriptional regulator